MQGWRTALALVLAVAPVARAGDRLDEAVAKAEAQLAKGKEADAVKILQKAADQAAGDPVAQVALARILTRTGRWDEAAAAYEKAGAAVRSAAPAARARVLAGLSDYRLRVGPAREALDLARQAVEAEGGGESLAARARAQARLGDPAARETAEKAVAAAPASASAHLARGDAQRAAHLYEPAAAAYRRALELEPRSAAAGSGLALALAGLRKGPEAVEAARAATGMDAHSGEVQAALGLVALAQDPEDGKGDAIAAVQQGAFVEPKNPAVKLAVGRVFESRGQLDQATAAYEEAARIDPSWAAPPVAALALQFRRGDDEGSLAGLRALPPELRAASEAQLLLGRLLLRRDDVGGAKAALDRAVAGLPGLAEAQAAHGSAAYNVGELTLAADAYGRAAQAEPGSATYRSNHGLFLGYDGRLDEGLKVLLALTGEPGYADPGGFVNLGWVYRSFKPARVAEAVAAYQKALALDPKSGQAALGIALSHRAGAQWAKAIAAYERVPQVDRKLEGEAHLGVAWCYYRSRDLYKAGFYTGLAARAGADVRALRAALAKAQADAAGPTAAASKPEDDLAELVDQLGSRDAGLQARAVKGLVRLGRPAVPYLAAALRAKGVGIAVREAIVDGLGRLGPAAREALPHLDRLIADGPPVPGIDDTREQMERQIREASLVSAARAAAARIRGR